MCRKDKRKGDIRFNRKSGHTSFVVRKHFGKYSNIGMSTKPFSKGKANVPMESNYDPKCPDVPSYFIKPVRVHPRSSFGPRLRDCGLTESDYSAGKKMYLEHLSQRKLQKRKKKKKPDHCP